MVLMIFQLSFEKEYQNKLIYLVPEKQLLNERIKNMQLSNTPGKTLRFVLFLF